MMFTRIITVALLGVLTIGIVGTGYWGYQEHRDKNAVLIKAENSYQRAFHDLNNNIANLEDELGKSIAVNTRRLMAPCMANIWRLAYSAQSNIGQLPLSVAPFSKSERFLAQVADFTYGIGMRNTDEERLTEKEWKQLQSLHKQAKQIQGELRKLQTMVIQDHLSWMDVELALASEEVGKQNQIVDGFTGLDKQIEGYLETEWGAEDNQFGDRVTAKKQLIQGKEITEKEAKQKGLSFLNLDENTEVDIHKNGTAREFTSYSLHVKHPDSERTTTIDISRKGGFVLWFLDSRDVEETKLGLNDAENKAQQFLTKRGKTSMESVESNQYDNVGVFDFVYQENGVRFYTDLIRVKVALDNGEIIGYEALDYIVGHQQPKPDLKPTLTREQAKEKVNGNLNVMEDRLSVVEIEAGEYKLCYELMGTIGDETYRMYVNAHTGEEEKIEKMKQAEPLV